MLKLKKLNVDQGRFIALLAKNARMQRDAILGKVLERDLDGLTSAPGEHNPTADLGLEPTNPQVAALREAIASLSADARAELYALMRIGQGHLAAATGHDGLVEADMLGDETVVMAIADDPDLHDHITKGLYEAKLES